jgi:predicted dehydrogenase
MDVCFNDLPGVTVVAVADPDEAGRAKAVARNKAARQYADYREMLAKEKPNLVSIAPRWSEEHRDMALAAIAAGAHLYMEKPITVTCAEADDILDAAKKANRKIAVAHQMRLQPAVTHLKSKVDAGLIGDLLQMNAYGKMDARAGGEDLLVLGVHLFDLMRMFAGEPQWVTSRVLDKGRDITVADARTVKEQIGPVAGDEIFATLAFPNGVNATFTSRARPKDNSGWWGLELVGSKGTARILNDIWPRVMFRPITPWTDAGRADAFAPLPDDASAKATKAEQSTTLANKRVAEDLVGAVRENREPTCSGANAAMALEMVMAVHWAALSGSRVALPLKERRHPLKTM